MKILTKGVLPEKTVMGGQCLNCKCVIECEKGEAKYTSDCRNEDYWSVPCPTHGCKSTIYLHETNATK